MTAEPLFALILKLLIVFGVGAAPGIEVWIAVPLGVLMGLSPPVVAAAAVTGNVASVAALVVMLPRFKNWFTRRFLPKQTAGATDELTDQRRFLLWDRYGVLVTISVKVAAERKQRLYYLWDRYGIPSAALGSPLLLGTHQIAALCIILGASAPRILSWITFSIVAWGVVLAIICHTAIHYLGLDPADFGNVQDLLNLFQGRP